ncbi:MAG TPA: hypothetical protein VGR89_00490 [Puia sp.]|nr:hypothetical protein [Puia sp.]
MNDISYEDRDASLTENIYISVGQLNDKLNVMIDRVDALQKRLDTLIESHNAVGENVAWLVANAQGIFQMFNDPKMINQMMGTMLSGGMGVPGGGQPAQ